MKIFLWLIAVVASAAIGFNFGVGQGAKTMSGIAAQNEVTNGLARIRVSLSALEKNDIAYAKKVQEQNLKSALFIIGTHSRSLPYWACTDKDRQTIQAAQKYMEANPDLLNGSLQQFETQGLAFCAEKVGGKSGGA